MPVHYCRKRSSKKYIEHLFNGMDNRKMEVSKAYKECKEKQLDTTSRQVFDDKFDAGNYAIF